MFELIILRAPSGFGKSTYAIKHYVSKGYIHCEADNHFLVEGEYKFDRSQLHNAHKSCQEKVENALKQGKNVIVSNTSTTRKEVQMYVDIAKRCDASYTVIRLTKQFQNTHGVPVEIVESMKARMQDYPDEIILTDY